MGKRRLSSQKDLSWEGTLLALWPGTGYLSFLSLCFFIWKMKITVPTWSAYCQDWRYSLESTWHAPCPLCARREWLLGLRLAQILRERAGTFTLLWSPKPLFCHPITLFLYIYALKLGCPQHLKYMAGHQRVHQITIKFSTSSCRSCIIGSFLRNLSCIETNTK